MENEKLSDSSDRGKKKAIAAEVIRPQKEIKEKWLDRVINQPDKYKLATARYILYSLFPSSQSQLHAQYSERILSAVAELNKTSEQAYVKSFSGALAPELCNQASVARLAQTNKDFESFSPSIVRSFKISHQEDERCLKIIQLVK